MKIKKHLTRSFVALITAMTWSSAASGGSSNPLATYTPATIYLGEMDGWTYSSKNAAYGKYNECGVKTVTVGNFLVSNTYFYAKSCLRLQNQGSVTKTVNLNYGSAITGFDVIDFKYRTKDYGKETGYLQYSLDNGDTWTTIDTIEKSNHGAVTYPIRSVTLDSAYDGQKLKVRVFNDSNKRGENIYIYSGSVYVYYKMTEDDAGNHTVQ